MALAKKLKQGSKSLNDLVVEALEKEVRRRRGWAAHQRIIARSETVKAKTGIQRTSGDLIRSFREGEKRRD
ncbi:YlcI/YnfO family protein [Tolypothrix sp. VBCCA 56010]|uniref:YlcI/YnfO family protein n=1 Tax=Tolypothrix sp. VBCCA 56010 TaxID=3137731 RepID=UPI003D7CFCFB